MPHQYLPETLALIEQAEREIAAEQATATDTTATDTSAVDNSQLAGIFAHLQANADAVRAEDAREGVALTYDRLLSEIPADVQSDPQWAGPSLPHPTEATSDEERAELDEGWDNWAKGIDPNQIHEGHYDSEAIEA